MSASWDNFTYVTNDRAFLESITKGKSEPYDGGEMSQLNIVRRFVEKYPERRRVMLDVGAHIGTTMLPYSRIFSNVYGFEPNKESYELCVKNIQHNAVINCSVEYCAVLHKSTYGVPVQHNTCNTGCFYFKEIDGLGTNGLGTNDAVPSKVLDNDPRFTNVDFLKIDTEGAEYYVLLGSLNLIQKDKPLIQAEMNGLCERNFGIPSATLLDLFSSLGYKNIPGTDFFYHQDWAF